MVNLKIQFLVLHLAVGLSSVQSCRNGATITDGCVPEKCIGGVWVPDSDETNSHCYKCEGCGDPHFTAFSGGQFMWSIGCNYALVQNDNTMHPEFGVFMDFLRKGDAAWVGAPTTYQEDRHTKVILDPTNPTTLFKVVVNGKIQTISQTTPTLLQGPTSTTTVYAWKHSPCLRLYGKPKILVELCQSTISIWAPGKTPSFPYTLGGFCGSTDNRARSEKKMVSRQGNKSRYPGPSNDANTNFGESWKAEEQTKTKCISGGKRKRSITEQSEEIAAEIIRKDCGHQATRLNGVHHEKCLDVHKGNGRIGDDHLTFCTFDLCMYANVTANQRGDFDEKKILEHHTEIHARRQFHNENTIESVPIISLAPHQPLFPQSPAPGIIDFAPESVQPPHPIIPLVPHQPLFPQSPAPGIIDFAPESVRPPHPIISLTPHQPNFPQSPAPGIINNAPDFSGIIGAGGSIAHQPSLHSSHIQPLQPGGFSLAATGRTGLHRPIGNTNFQRRGTPIGNTNFQRRGTPNGNTNFQRRGSAIGNTNFQRRGTPIGNTNFQRRGSPIGNTNFQRRRTPNGNTNFQRRRNPQPQSLQRRQWG